MIIFNKKIEVIGHNYDWVRETCKRTELDEEMTNEQTKSMNKFIEKIRMAKVKSRGL